MWISKERWNALNTRIADLERRVQSQQTILLPYISINYDGEIKLRSNIERAKESYSFSLELSFSYSCRVIIVACVAILAIL